MSRWILTFTDDGKYPTVVEKGESYICFSMHSDICMLHQLRKRGFIHDVDLSTESAACSQVLSWGMTPFFWTHIELITMLETYDIPNSSQCLYKFVSKCPFQDTTLWICNYLLILILCFPNIPTMFVQKTSRGFRNPIPQKKDTSRFALFCIWKRWWPSCCISQHQIVQSLCAEIYGASTGGWLVLGPGNLKFLRFQWVLLFSYAKKSGEKWKTNFATNAKIYNVRGSE